MPGHARAVIGARLGENLQASAELGFRAGLRVAGRSRARIGLWGYGETGEGGGTTHQNHTATDGRGAAGVGEGGGTVGEITADVHSRE